MKDIKIKQLYEIIAEKSDIQQAGGLKTCYNRFKDWVSSHKRSLALAAAILLPASSSLATYALIHGQVRIVRDEIAVVRDEIVVVKKTYESGQKQLAKQVSELGKKVDDLSKKLVQPVGKGISIDSFSDGSHCIKINGKKYACSFSACTNVLDTLQKHALSHRQSNEEIASIIQDVDSNRDYCISDYESKIGREKAEIAYKPLEDWACQALEELSK